MKLIVGLGNPGKKYENTRHNIGFKVIDQLCEDHNLSLNKEKFQGLYSLERINGQRVIFFKPLTYMNLSGQAIRAIVDFYNIEIDNILVIYDDLDLPVGKIRLRQKGSAGGHNGIKSTIAHLGTDKFKRIRIGVDRPQQGMSVSNYVLTNFSKDEAVTVQGAVEDSAKACIEWLNKPFINVMNEFN